MKKPEPAPKWTEGINSYLHLLRNADIQNFVSRFNNEYLYWDGFKQQIMPEGLSAAQCWGLLKFTRIMAQRKSIDLVCGKGKPFTYWLPDKALELLHYIDQHASGQMLIDEPGVHSEERNRYMIKSIVNEAISSSQLEGASTTRVVAREMIRTGRKPVDRSEMMIYNNYLAIKLLEEHLREPLSPELITTIHGRLTTGTLEQAAWEGRFRQHGDEQVEVYDRTAEQNVLHVPPLAGSVKDLMGAMCDFANRSSEGEFIHPVVRAIVLHFWLAWVHPFMDGNGRTARALFYWYLIKTDYWLIRYLSVSTAILNARSQYDKSFLYTESDDNDLTYFIMYNLDAICLAIADFKQYISAKQDERRSMINVLRAQPWLNVRQQLVLARSLKNPDERFTLESHKNVHGVTHQTARMDLQRLCDAGFLIRSKQGRKFVFTPVGALAEKLSSG